MTFDHSESYKGYGIRALGHRNRLKAILKEVNLLGVPEGGSYCDLGCSNGYITDQIRKRLHLQTTGLDHKFEHLHTGRERYPEIKFEEVDLNKQNIDAKKFDLVTCFETLEHVGNLENAVQNIVSRIALGGRALVTVPIEHGTRGVLKYCLKKIIFRYSAAELNLSEGQYFRTLISGRRISEARPEASGYGTHFGFDYRDVDDLLIRSGANFSASNQGMTRFYRIQSS